jgi:galactose oxidase
MQVLVWSAWKANDFDRRNRFVKTGGGSGLTRSAIYDSKTGKISNMMVSNTQHDMFCPGALLPL